MADKNEFKYVEDILSAFDAGMNSGDEPIDVPKNQICFGWNSTVRGRYITNRPANQIQSIIGAVWSTIQSVGIFQGAVYFAPDAGQQGLIAQIGGRLFTFTPDTNDTNVAIVEVTIPGDPNPSGLPQAWLLNAERWVIINNGVNNPIFYDTTTGISRRSVPISASIAVTDPTPTAGQFVTPVLGGTMVVPLVALGNMANFLNETVQLVEFDDQAPPQVFATTNWEVVAVGGAITTYNITLKNLGDAAGATQGQGSQLIIQPGTIGNVLTFSGNFVVSPSSHGTMTLGMSSAVPNYVIVGTVVSLNGDANWVVSSINATRTILNFIYSIPGQNPFAPPFPPGGVINFPVFAVSNTQPNVTLGTLLMSFTAPATGVTVPAVLTSAYTGAIGQILFINNEQYQVTAYQTTAGASNTTVTLLNLNDTRTGHVFNAITMPVSTTAAQIFNFPELPPGRNLAYTKGRIWEALTDAISYIAGDIVGGSAGSPAFGFRDAILKVSENSLLAGGGSFKVPSNLGQIAAMRPMAQQNAAFGQGPLMVVCPGGVFSCDAPTDRTTWATMTTPIVTEPLIGLGGLSQNSTIVCNGDLIFRAVDGIRSLIMGERQFYSWGQTPISHEMDRIIDGDDVAGLPYSSAVQFDNRMLMTAVPTQGPQGVYHQGLMALNFDPISSIRGKAESVYDGFWTGINVLQLIEGQFSGIHRCFAFTYSTASKQIELYELTKTKDKLNFDNGSAPIVWGFESPFLFKDVKSKGLFDIVSLEDGEFYVKDVQAGSTVDFKIEYQPDFSSCWFPWHEFSICNSPSSTQPTYGCPLGLGKPQGFSTGSSSRNSNFANWFRKRYTFIGHCKYMGSLVKAALQPRSEFTKPISRKPVTPLTNSIFSNAQIISDVLCDTGTLTYANSLPAGFSIVGNQIVLGAGFFTGETQALADAAAVAALDNFISTMQANLTLTCAVTPPGGCVDWSTLLWGDGSTHTNPGAGSITATFTPNTGNTGGVFVAEMDFTAATGNAYIGPSPSSGAFGDAFYNNTGCNANLHLDIQLDAGLVVQQGHIFIFNQVEPGNDLDLDITGLTTGSYDFPFTIMDSLGITNDETVVVVLQIRTGGSPLTGTYKITGTLTNL